jgi:2-polyprenyl-3-methyl-5-hydroxy-6-metoxy-1,4-benzoquinol methylase
MADHDRELRRAFDARAAAFERAPVQSDPAALDRLVSFAAVPAGSRVLDAGCGPGLVSAALLRAGCRVFGVDLSPEMIDRARARCAEFGDRARFERQSLFDPLQEGGFDAAVSRYVIHHVVDPLAFLRRQVELLRPGGIVVASDHTTDPDPERARGHNELERLRDRTHTRSLTAGELADALAGAGLQDVHLVEERFALDFDEWFDRGTAAKPKAAVRALLLSGPGARGFMPREVGDGRVRIDSWRALVRGVKPV